MTLACLMLFGGSAAAAYYYEISDAIQTVEIGHLLGSQRPSIKATTEADRSPGDPFAGRAVNLLIIGIDSRQGDNGLLTDRAWDSVLNDVTWIVHISADRRRMDVTSIPRDTLVDIPSCTQADGTETNPWSNKQINWSWGRGTGGAETEETQAAGIACVAKTVESVTQIRLDAWALVDFSGFARMVDALGGVDLCVDRAIKSKESRLDIQPGMNHFDGLNALRFARTRKGTSSTGPNLDGSDYQRVSRQQQLIAALIHRLLANQSLSSVPALNNFALAAFDSLKFDPTIGSVSAMAGLAYSLRHIDMANVSLVITPVVDNQSDHNRFDLDESGDGEYTGLGIGAYQLFELLASDQPVPGTVPYLLANPSPAARASDAAGTPTAKADAAGSPPAGTGQPEPAKGVTTPLNAPVTCQTG